MTPRVALILAELMSRRPELAPCEGELLSAYGLLEACFRAGGKVLACGNGGSAADADHIVGELMKGFRLRRPLGPDLVEALERAIPGGGRAFADSLQAALPAMSLVGQTSLSTAFANDVAPEMVFAQQVLGYGRPGDLLLALSCSGDSPNVVNAALAARAFGLAVLGLSGRGGGRLARVANLCLRGPADETWEAQELHQSVYHALCAMLEENFFGDP